MSGRTKFILAFSLSILILVVIGVFAYRNTNDYRSATDWTSHTREVISQAQIILSDVQEIETAQRGFVITGEERYLKPYEDGLRDIEKSYLLLKNLISDNPSQQLLLDTIHYTINLKIDFAKKVVYVRQKDGFEEAQKLVFTGAGENLMVETRGLVRNFIGHENELLAKRLNNAKQKFSSAITIIIASIALTIVIVIFTMFFFIRDYDKRIYSEKKLQEYKHFFHNSYDLACIATTQGYFEVLNPNWGKVLGYTTKELCENPFLYFVHPDDINLTLKEIEKLNAGALTINFQNRYRKKDGDYLWFNWSSTPDPITGKLYAIARNVTEQKIKEQELMQAKKSAEESVILKEAFLANMSHEIRTPMNAILGFTDLLLQRNLQDQEKDFVRTIKTSGENLLRIINDILDISKIDSGMMDFEEHSISIKELFTSLNIMFSQKACEKKLILSFDVDHSIPEALLGDPTRLTQIIVNLVGNSIKFTKKGSVAIFAKIFKEEQEIYQVMFSIKDTGIGIPEDKLQFIFERFRQAESHTTRNYGGTGLGLSIAKQMIELQGGNITVKSIEGVGSIFSFILPFKKTKNLNSNPHSAHNEFDIHELSKLNILIAEDNPINIKFILSLFMDHNINADTAENGKLAVEMVKNKHYDLILMDIEMPELNGYDTTLVIRKDLKSDIPIIAMTANAMAGEKEKCLQFGMNDYITKPIKSKQLFEKMFLATAPKANNENNKKNKIVNLDFLIRSMKGKKEVIRDTIDIFLQQAPEDLSAINEAVSNTDFLSIRKSSHKMKSTVSLMGISVMANILEEMEILSTASKEIERIKTLNHSLKILSEQAIQEIYIEKLNYI